MACTSTRPHIIVVPGACHTPHHWRLFKTSMESTGYDVTIQRLLANVEDGTGPLSNAMSKSVAAVRAAVVKKIEDGHDVIVIGHSAGGAVIGGALVGLAKKGPKPGVVRAVYLAGFLLEPGGESMLSKAQGNMPPYMGMEDGFAVFKDAKEWFYNDVPDDIADDAVRHLVGCSASLTEGSIAATCWFEVPSVYILCQKDKAIPPAVAEWVIAAAKVDWDVVRLDAGHSPFLSMPDTLAAAVRYFAGEGDVDLEGVTFDKEKVDAEKASQEAGWTQAAMDEVRRCKARAF